jgi:hypothetical protein
MSGEPVSSTKVAVWTALITAIATVLTAFITIFPQLRQNDQKTIGDLTNQITKLTAKLSQEAYRVSGHVKTRKNDMPVVAAMFFAAPANDAVPLDDSGKFDLPNMADQAYYIVVQTQDGKTSRVLINPSDPLTETDTEELAITYSFSKE